MRNEVRQSIRRMWKGLAVVFPLAIAMAGCSGGGAAAPPPPPPSFSISPASANAVQGGTVTFTGSPAQSITWSVQEGSAGGTITSGGVYTAPMAAGLYHVVGTAGSLSATASVSVPSVQVSVTPTATSVGPSTTESFSASVSGAANTAVTWSVQEGVLGGAVTSTGAYTAPNGAGIFHVTATSVADNTKKATAAVTVTPIVVTVVPPSDTLGPNGERSFDANLTASSSAGVQWSIQEGSIGGAITTSGDYTASPQTGIYHPLATSVADASRSGSAVVSVVPAGFRPVSGMSQSRVFHTATRLSSGKVLIAGGNQAQVGLCGPVVPPSTQAELFDPQDSSFKSVGPMVSSHSGHSATLLKDGRVLIAGGGTAAAEIFDPATQSFSATGFLTIKRTNHTATLLPDGRVLLAGGDGTKSAEIFDPAKKSFTAIGDMSTSRSHHTATLLNNGKILLAGGSGDSSTELFDPATGTFSAAANMSVPRSGHQASLVGANVLITGGTDGSVTFATAELYDSVTNTFTAAANMLDARAFHSAVLLSSGMVLVAGGSASGSTVFSAELYDPANNTFTRTGSLKYARDASAVAMLTDGRVLVTGGDSLGLTLNTPSPLPLATAEVYQ